MAHETLWNMTHRLEGAWDYAVFPDKNQTAFAPKENVAVHNAPKDGA
jgi:hypothetical protein